MKRKPSIRFQLVALFVIVSFAILFSSCASRKPVFSSKWKADLQHELQSPNQDFFLFPKSNVMLKAFNNNEGIQVVVRIADESTQLRVLRNGLSIFVDTTGKQKERFAAVIPSVHPQMDMADREKGPKHPDVSSLVLNTGALEILVKKGDRVSSLDTRYIHISVDSIHNLNYTVTLPFAILDTKNYKGKIISIGLKSGSKINADMQRPTDDMGGDDMPGGPPPGMGPDSNNNSMLAPINEWVNISLTSD